MGRRPGVQNGALFAWIWSSSSFTTTGRDGPLFCGELVPRLTSSSLLKRPSMEIFTQVRQVWPRGRAVAVKLFVGSFLSAASSGDLARDGDFSVKSFAGLTWIGKPDPVFSIPRGRALLLPQPCSRCLPKSTGIGSTSVKSSSSLAQNECQSDIANPSLGKLPSPQPCPRNLPSNVSCARCQVLGDGSSRLA